MRAGRRVPRGVAPARPSASPRPERSRAAPSATSACRAASTAASVLGFFRSRRHAACDLTDADGNDLSARALARLGPLRYDEMRGFVPALAF